MSFSYKKTAIVATYFISLVIVVGCSGSGNGVDISADADFDSVIDNLDNCLMVSNKNQSDINHDGIGDACDPNFLAQISIILDN